MAVMLAAGIGAVGSIAGGLLGGSGGGGSGVQKWIGRETAQGIQDKNAGYNDIFSQLQGLGTNGNAYVAGMTPDQLQAIQQIRSMQGMGQGDYAQLMAQMKSYAANPVTAGPLSQFLNPYTQDVVNTTMGDIDRQRQMSLVGNGSNAEMSNAFGGTRQAVTDSLTNGEFGRIGAQTYAQLRDQGYTNAQGAQQQDFANRMASRGQQISGNASLANLIAQRRQAAGADASALYGVGSDQQSLNQQRMNWPLQRLQMMLQANQGFNPAGGAVPNQPNGFVNAMGGAMAGGQMAQSLYKMFGGGTGADQAAVNNGVAGIYGNTNAYLPQFNNQAGFDPGGMPEQQFAGYGYQPLKFAPSFS